MKKSNYHVFQYPYILIEDISSLHRPLYKEYVPAKAKQKATWPQLYLDSPPIHCPFLPSGKSRLQNTVNEKAAQVKRQSRRSTKPVPKPGYCECCYQKYSDLDKHVQSDFHRKFATDDLNYEELDSLLALVKRPLVTFDSPVGSPPSPLCLRNSRSQNSRKKLEYVEKDSPLKRINQSSEIDLTLLIDGCSDIVEGFDSLADLEYKRIKYEPNVSGYSFNQNDTSYLQDLNIGNIEEFMHELEKDSIIA